MKIATVKELAELLRIKPKTLYQWSELGQIPHLKLNGSLRFDMERIEKWLGDCSKEPNIDYNIITKLEARKGGKNK